MIATNKNALNTIQVSLCATLYLSLIGYLISSLFEYKMEQKHEQIIELTSGIQAVIDSIDILHYSSATLDIQQLNTVTSKALPHNASYILGVNREGQIDISNVAAQRQDITSRLCILSFNCTLNELGGITISGNFVSAPYTNAEAEDYLAYVTIWRNGTIVATEIPIALPGYTLSYEQLMNGYIIIYLNDSIQHSQTLNISHTLDLPGNTALIINSSLTAFIKDNLDALLTIIVLTTLISIGTLKYFSIRKEHKNSRYDALTHTLRADELKSQAVSKIIASTQGAILVFDGNKIKQINDSLGHLAGNEAIKLLADAIKSRARQSDVVIRFGGDEFILLARGMQQRDKVENLILDIRDNLDKSRLSHYELKETQLSFSCGYSFFHEADNISDLLKLADSRMYDEKRDVNTAS